MDLVDSSTPLPLWFTEEDLTTYGALYEKSGFQTALQIPHRSVGKDFTIADAKVKVPVLLIMGGKDYVLKFQGMEDYIKSGKVKEVVHNLEITFLPEGTHFVQEQSPNEVLAIRADTRMMLRMLAYVHVCYEVKSTFATLRTYLLEDKGAVTMDEDIGDPVQLK
ncbi:epoxide hydrolase b [Fagus crenata]